ncbi:DUF4440 domain-containing protein [Xylophilus rhododendri]|uniref:DUF4440 domain-containing protein n=2 Tax=Xylophilus rhododendri TaxID=2697032 RepID=A0A857JED7_9BURK|nr:nuclear transport factor 2 family protein [Xylophilus rhododendri]QHJ01562.1 DUF4440 domain-containing protein [Xylophilus rhododendri]
MRSDRMSSTAAVGGRPDDVEAEFYEALRVGDLARMMACWADEDDIVCVHPGGPRLVGTGQIRASFEALFERGTPPIRHETLHRVETLVSSVHSVLEKVALTLPDGAVEAAVIATNVFHKTAQGWRMVAHHASPGTVAETTTDPRPEVSPTLH